jgi:hypothetical protein
MTLRLSLAAAALFVAVGAASGTARAQESTPAPSPAPVAAPEATEHPTFMDQQYDGRLHINAAPYIWAPTLKSNYQFSIPALPRAVGGVAQGSVQIPPVDYASKLNTAAMLAFSARMGQIMVLGDYIYVNASTTASVSGSIAGPLGRRSIPYSIDTNARLATSIWELAGGFSIAHGHNADLNVFAGWRQFPSSLTFDYNATVGKRGIIAPSGTVVSKETQTDAIFGIQGKAYFSDDHWYIPYYADYGVGATNQSWQAYGGAGYTFNHGQSIVVLYRTLNYSGFPSGDVIQKLSMGGPLIGYTFPL